MERPILFPDISIELPIQFFGSVEYYALMSAFGRVFIDPKLRYDKRFKSTHRTLIADTHGPTTITVPVVKPTKPKPTWNDVKISDHNHWWTSAEETLASAYGRTPFYEFYIDRLRQFFSQTTISSFESVGALDEALNRVICDILDIGCVIYSNPTDLSERTTHVSLPEAMAMIKKIEPVPYYQVRQSKQGFIGSLSILDLLFNLGPESPLHLYCLVQQMKSRFHNSSTKSLCSAKKY